MQVPLEDSPMPPEYVPLTHAVHCVAPTMSENVPTPHSSHVSMLVAPSA